MEDTKIDFRKLNTEYVISTISEKIKKSMSVPVGTMLKCIKDGHDDWYKNQILIKADKSYEVLSSNLSSNGYLSVTVRNELGRNSTHLYSHFEDMAFHRDDLLNELFS